MNGNQLIQTVILSVRLKRERHDRGRNFRVIFFKLNDVVERVDKEIVHFF